MRMRNAKGQFVKMPKSYAKTPINYKGVPEQPEELSEVNDSINKLCESELRAVLTLYSVVYHPTITYYSEPIWCVVEFSQNVIKTERYVTVIGNKQILYQHKVTKEQGNDIYQAIKKTKTYKKNGKPMYNLDKVPLVGLFNKTQRSHLEDGKLVEQSEKAYEARYDESISDKQKKESK